MGTRVVVLEVTDADIGDNAAILYEGIRGQFAPQFLEVDQDTGEITTFKYVRVMLHKIETMMSF